MVSAYNKHFSISLRESAYESIKKTHGLCRRERFVIDISRYQNSLRLFFVYYCQDAFKYKSLIFYHREVIYPLSNMKI